MKKIILLFLFLVAVGVAYAAPVKITASGEAYGHHGACEGWNACGSPQECALLACKANGFQKLVSYGDVKPCTELGDCQLFNYDLSVDCNWGNFCAVAGVTDIWCDEGTWTGACSATLPDQSGSSHDSKNSASRGSKGKGNGDITITGDEEEEEEETNPEVPEFGVVAAGIALVGALAIFAVKRK